MPKNLECAEGSGVFEFADAISPAWLSSCVRPLEDLYTDSVVERSGNQRTSLSIISCTFSRARCPSRGAAFFQAKSRSARNMTESGENSLQNTEKQSEITDAMKSLQNDRAEDARYCWAFSDTYTETYTLSHFREIITMKLRVFLHNQTT
jgi:hypothetical protein